MQVRLKLPKWVRLESKMNRAKLQMCDRESHCHEIYHEWLQIPSSQLKRRLVQMFKNGTSQQTLAMFTCASCAESVWCSEQTIMSLETIDSLLLWRPDKQDQHMSADYFDRDCPLPPFSFADSDGPLCDLILDPSGVTQCSDGQIQLSLCNDC